MFLEILVRYFLTFSFFGGWFRSLAFVMICFHQVSCRCAILTSCDLKWRSLFWDVKGKIELEFSRRVFESCLYSCVNRTSRLILIGRECCRYLTHSHTGLGVFDFRPVCANRSAYDRERAVHLLALAIHWCHVVRGAAWSRRAGPPCSPNWHELRCHRRFSPGGDLDHHERNTSRVWLRASVWRPSGEWMVSGEQVSPCGRKLTL